MQMKGFSLVSDQRHAPGSTHTPWGLTPMCHTYTFSLLYPKISIDILAVCNKRNKKKKMKKRKKKRKDAKWGKETNAFSRVAPSARFA